MGTLLLSKPPLRCKGAVSLLQQSLNIAAAPRLPPSAPCAPTQVVSGEGPLLPYRPTGSAAEDMRQRMQRAHRRLLPVVRFRGNYQKR
jgi:hypothetical protein